MSCYAGLKLLRGFLPWPPSVGLHFRPVSPQLAVLSSQPYFPCASYFFVQLTQAKAIREDEKQTEKTPVSDWTAGISVGHFLDYWLMGKAELSVGSTTPEQVAMGYI